MKFSRLIAASGLLGVALATTACDRAISNMQTLLSDDCGRTWRALQPGDTIPSRMGVCALKVTIPSYPMQGDAAFKVNYKNRVLVSTSTSYEYTIVDPLKFIVNARYLGRQNSEGDDKENTTTRYESAENMLIDKRIREVASTMLREEDIVDFDQGKFEDKLLVAANEALKDRGIVLNSIAFVPTPDDQTRTAIDSTAAIRVYDAAGMREIGEKIMVARASAPNITVNSTPAPTDKDSDKN